jgi:hypothetical protein
MAYGQVSADVINTSVSGSSLGAGNASIMKNRIINGAMVIDQRNAGSSVTLSGDNTFDVDRWAGWGGGGTGGSGKFTMQQNAGSVTPPVGFVNYCGITSSSAYTVATGDYYAFSQQIEGFNTADLQWGTANAKTVTLSFWAYSSLTGTFGGSLANSARNRSYPFTYSIPVANTWTQISVTIAGDTTGTWLTTNGVGIRVNFGLGVGSTYYGSAGSWSASNYWSASGCVNVVSTNAATWNITGVQLEVGSSATGYEYRQYGTEVSLCQRYFCKSWAIGTAPSNASGAGEIAAIWGSTDSSTLQMQNTCFPVTMRTNPTITFYSGSQPAGNQTNGCWSYYISGGFRNTVAPITATLTPQYMGVYSYGSQAIAPTTGYAYIGGGCYTASAEL